MDNYDFAAHSGISLPTTKEWANVEMGTITFSGISIDLIDAIFVKSPKINQVVFENCLFPNFKVTSSSCNFIFIKCIFVDKLSIVSSEVSSLVFRDKCEFCRFGIIKGTTKYLTIMQSKGKLKLIGEVHNIEVSSNENLNIRINDTKILENLIIKNNLNLSLRFSKLSFEEDEGIKKNRIVYDTKPDVIWIVDNSFLDDFYISNSIFKKKIEIINNKFKGFKISNNTFKSDVVLINNSANGLEINISSLEAKKRLIISNQKIQEKENIENEQGLIDEIKTIEKLIFDKLPPRTYLENLNIGELDFSRNTIEDKEILSLTNLGIRLLKIENFINYGFFTINNFKPSKEDKIEISNSTLGKLDLVSCDLSKVSVEIDNSKLVDIFYTDTLFPDEIGSNKENAKARLEQQRDTYGQLKVVSEKVGNRFQALKFQAKEMAAYYESIKSAEKKNDILEKIYNFFKSIQIWVSNKFWKEERIILFVMKYSNNFRQSWVRGVLFTFIAGLIPFIFFTWSLNNTDWCLNNWSCFSETSKVFGYYFEFLNPAHKTDFVGKENIGNWTYLWDFIGRIFIGFGIYQTIQSFRKFGKE